MPTCCIKQQEKHTLWYKNLLVMSGRFDYVSFFCFLCKVWQCTLKNNRVNNSLHPWSEEISFVEEWISLDSNSSRVKIHYSTSGISCSSLDIHSKRSDHWRHYTGSDVSDKYSENSLYFLRVYTRSLMANSSLKFHFFFFFFFFFFFLRFRIWKCV